MYAVIESGGKQYRVNLGDQLKLEKLPHEAGETIVFDKILMVSDGAKQAIGTPYVAKAKVQAEVLAQGRHPKIRIIKLKRRKHHMKRMGHRQDYTEVRIAGIDWNGA